MLCARVRVLVACATGKQSEHKPHTLTQRRTRSVPGADRIERHPIILISTWIKSACVSECVCVQRTSRVGRCRHACCDGHVCGCLCVCVCSCKRWTNVLTMDEWVDKGCSSVCCCECIPAVSHIRCAKIMISLYRKKAHIRSSLTDPQTGGDYYRCAHTRIGRLVGCDALPLCALYRNYARPEGEV